MNYIYHLNSFFAKADGQDWLTPHHHCLYLALFRIWNQTGFKETFVITREDVMKKAKIGSKTTYYRCLKELENAGYLKYHSSKVKYEAATITMTSFMCTKKGTGSVPNMNLTNPTNGTPSVPEMGHIPKREIKTSLNNDSNSRSRPTQEEVNQFFQEHQYTLFMAISFWYQYESKNWYCNGYPVKDWQALAHKWVANIIQQTLKITKMHPEATEQIKSIATLFDYRQILQQLQEKGRRLFGEHFRIYKEDLPVIVPVIAWMLRDTDVTAQYGMDLKKGIFLSGPVGVGKTQLMQLMRYLTAPSEDYNVLSCTKLALDFGRIGTNLIHHYTYGSFNSSDNKPLTYCFDDLGKEILVKHYGTTCQIMQQIILARYELFIQHGMITHVTSSMHTLQIEERYGTEIRSRLREMFNKIGFDNNANDKRTFN